MYRTIKYDGKGNLAENPIGLHVTMEYKRQTLLGEVTDVEYNRSNGLAYLYVKHFSGEHWPLQPIASEVSALVRTYPDTEE